MATSRSRCFYGRGLCIRYCSLISLTGDVRCHSTLPSYTLHFLIQSKTSCRPGDPAHSFYTNVNGNLPLKCATGGVMVGCSIWDDKYGLIYLLN